MKKIISVFALTALFSLAFVNNNFGQDLWTQGKTAGIYSIGIGGTDAITVGNNGFGGTYSGLSAPGLSINVSGEYKVYKFIGVGWQSGFDIIFNRYYYGYFGGSGSYITLGIPFIAKCNVHILDAVGGVSIADKLDVYAGLNFGGGPAITPANNNLGTGTSVGGFIQVGPTVGARYWVVPKVAVFAEFGFGATFANAGVTF